MTLRVVSSRFSRINSDVVRLALLKPNVANAEEDAVPTAPSTALFFDNLAATQVASH